MAAAVRKLAGCACNYSKIMRVSRLSPRFTSQYSSPKSSACFTTVSHHRNFQTSAGPLRHGDYEWQDPKSEDEVVNIIIVNKQGERVPVRGKIGDNLLYLAKRYEIPMEGACEASLACSTCHVYVADEFFDKLADPEEKEEDMLDLAVFLRPNSRLGCQIILSKELEGLELSLPQATRNFYVDGHVPEPH